MPDKKTPSPEDIAHEQNPSPDKEEQSVDPSYSSAENGSEAVAEEQ
jgi:hypothetical protein